MTTALHIQGLMLKEPSKICINQKSWFTLSFKKRGREMISYFDEMFMTESTMTLKNLFALRGGKALDLE